MRIAFLTPVYPPMVSGASIGIHRLSNSMAARGHTVLVITSSDGPKPYNTQEGNLSTLRLRSFRNPLRVGQRVVRWPEQEVLKRLENFSPDILHVSDPLQFALPGLKFSEKNKIPGVYAIQQLPWFITSYLPSISWLQKGLEKILWAYGNWLIGQFDAVVTPTRTIAKIVKEHTNITPHTISNGVELELFKPGLSENQSNNALRKKLGVPFDIPIILHVGRLDYDKKVDVAITACAPVLIQTKAHMLVVGDGRERERLTRLAYELGIASKCHFTGFVSITDGLADIYRLASAFIITSQIETQGIVLLEAAASGIPIVAIDSTCIPEIVLHNVNGFLVSPGQLERMESYLTQLIQDPSRARKMGMEGRKIALNHSIEKSMDIYEKLLIKCYQTSSRREQLKITNQKLERRYFKIFHK